MPDGRRVDAGTTARRPRLLSLRDVAEATPIPRTTWYTLVARGELPVVRCGRSLRVDERDVLWWIERHKETGE